MRDLLSDKESEIGTLVLNHGDPAYRTPIRPQLPITAAEDIFLRVISYLPFAETVIVPGRHLLDGENAFAAAVMAAPLFKQGLVVPERRFGSSSFTEVAQARQLGQREVQRADYLDQHAKVVREFKWDVLSGTYRAILLDDLGPTGGFRRIVSGAMQGNLKQGIDAALDTYEKSDGVTPEGFISAVEQACPQAAALARRWAMARYYLTPTQFDDINIRQIPKDAADLLVKGRAIDRSLKPVDELPPADRLAQEISVGVKVDEVRRSASAYCEAALRVRDDVPQARILFQKMVGEAEARELGEEVTSAMAKELSKQLRKRIVDEPVYSLAVDIMAGVGGAAAALPLGIAGALGAAVAAAGTSAATKHVVKAQYDKAKRPWKLAIDQLKSAVNRNGTDNEPSR